MRNRMAPAPGMDPEAPIPFNKPSVAGRELEYAAQAIRGGRASGDGPFTKCRQSFLEARLGVAKALLTTSCAHALEMSALLLDLQPGYEVILPSFTFVSTVRSGFLRGQVDKHKWVDLGSSYVLSDMYNDISRHERDGVVSEIAAFCKE